MKAAILTVSLIFCLGCCLPPVWQTSEQSLNGAWHFEYSMSPSSPFITTKIPVPSNWSSLGIDHHGVAFYNRELLVDTINLHERLWLVFDAIDYSADLSVNGKLLAQHNGYFSPFKTEITQAVIPGVNQIDVKVTSPIEENGEDWSLNKTLIKGVLSHHDTRPGSAWSSAGQDRNSGGIWGNVNLVSTGPVAISSFKVTPSIIDLKKRHTGGSATVELDSYFRGQIRVDFHLMNMANNTLDSKHSTVVNMTQDRQEIQWTLPEKPRELWWPWDWGHPTIYSLKVTVAVIDELFGLDKVSDFKKVEIGFRQFEFDEKNATFYVNGEAYFIRGTNYIASQWLGEMAVEDYENDILLMQEANINSVRVHAHVAGKAFYQLADRHGLIIWQDFPLQWGYLDEPYFTKEAVRQTKVMTDMLYNHASIAFWCGHNEPPWDAAWMAHQYKNYQANHNKTLTEAVYRQLLKTQDARIVRKASFTREHPWFGWYWGRYQFYRTKPLAPIVSEFGAQALPSVSLMRKILAKSTKNMTALNGADFISWPLTFEDINLLKYHNYQPEQTLNIAKVSMGNSLQEFVQHSQAYQARSIKYASESLRLRRKKDIAAIYQFMFVDSWPSITWSVLDYKRRPKKGFDTLKQAYQILLPVVEALPNNHHPLLVVALVNDSRIRYHNASLWLVDETSDTVLIQVNVDIKPNDLTRINLPVSRFNMENFSLIVKDPSGKVLSINEYNTKQLEQELI
ncbi:sugar-binding domain-containing protein [uncultured Shewanella sp.]|uniref:glycoside hydrolase family 2 protein n=1 Tax=uncultured Shewanella sp. TaxID=173975 RepID=UPI00260FA907|nr:sugar-binding domain-containing protein [uncultured Shewanella sp.]